MLGKTENYGQKSVDKKEFTPFSTKITDIVYKEGSRFRLRIMIKTVVMVCLTMLLLSAAVFANYPATLDNGNLVLVDGGMGVGRYADRTSVVVERYAPPDYQIAINVVSVTFSDDYWQQHETYIGGPYTLGDVFTLRFCYDWNIRSTYQFGTQWQAWDINRDYSHAEGDPMIPDTAEVAFVSAYNMRFFDDKTGYSPVLKRQRRVIDESLYQAMGI